MNALQIAALLDTCTTLVQSYRCGSGSDLQEAAEAIERELEKLKPLHKAITFAVPCTPVGQPRTQTSYGRHYTPGKEIGAFKQAVLWGFRKAAGVDCLPHAGPVLVTIDAFFPRDCKELLSSSAPEGPILMIKTPDTDNVEKAVLDGLTAPKKLRGAKKTLSQPLTGYPWIDDCQVHSDGVRRWYSGRGSQPGVIIRIVNVEGVECHPKPKKQAAGLLR